MLSYCEMKAALGAGAKRLLLRTPLRRFVRCQDGVAAIEFGMVAAPFLAMLFAIAETSLIFFAGQTLETATADSGRMLMTGEANAFNADQFKTEVCKRLHGMFGNVTNCKANLTVEVFNFGKSFSPKPPAPTLNELGKLPDSYQPPKASCVMMVRVMYQWSVYVTLEGLNLSNIAPGKRLLSATSVFRTEPYGTPTC
jgi:Flp pilus assembly protein TadG